MKVFELSLFFGLIKVKITSAKKQKQQPNLTLFYRAKRKKSTPHFISCFIENFGLIKVKTISANNKQR